MENSIEFVVNIDKYNIIISCNETINHFLHVLNIYGLLGNHGKKYLLKNDENVINSIDNQVLDKVKEGDYYFSYGSLNIYKTGMDFIMDNELWKQPVDEQNVVLNISECEFNKALLLSWTNFYKEYWKDSFEQTKKNFLDCINSFDIEEYLKKMEKAVQKKLAQDFFIFTADALQGSALNYRDNICMGIAEKGSDIGFVHEGLHLLLNEEWAKNAEINNIINSYGYTDDFYHSWKAKYEQALVIALDCCIQNYHNRYAKNYFDGCHVGDLFDIVYPLIRDYYDNGCKGTIENLTVQIFKHKYGIK